MTRSLPSLLLAALVFAGTPDSSALESEAVARPGIRSVRLLTDIEAIVPGGSFTVGLLLDPLPGHHTYWRGPGIVGVATTIDWTLPAGFEAGEILWPPPTPVLMAGIVANGYKGPVLLLAEIVVPEKIEAKDVTLAARASWMSCAVSCNPGIADLSLSLPVASPGETPSRDAAVAETFAKARRAAPAPAPEAWRFVPRLTARDRIELEATIPGLDPAHAPKIRFYCDDMQIDSDEPQQVEVVDASKGRLRFVFARPEFAPTDAATLSGVLHCPDGWPETDSLYVEISAPWPGPERSE